MSVMSFENIQTSKVIEVFLISQAAFDVKKFVFVKFTNNIILFLTNRENKLAENELISCLKLKTVTIVCKFYLYFIFIALFLSCSSSDYFYLNW